MDVDSEKRKLLKKINCNYCTREKRGVRRYGKMHGKLSYVAAGTRISVKEKHVSLVSSESFLQIMNSYIHM